MKNLRQRINNAGRNADSASLRGAREYYDQEQQDLIGEYNRAVVPDSVEDYGGDLITGYFDQDDPYIDLYRQDPHPGIDFIGGESFKTPWYTVPEATNLSQESHSAVLSVPGTSYRIRVKHGDLEDVQEFDRAIGTGTVYKPGENILPYPERPNGTIAIHFHVEVRTTNGHGAARMRNPIGLNAGSASEYFYDYTGSGGWGPMSYGW